MRWMLPPAVMAAIALSGTAFAQLPPSTAGRTALASFNRIDRDGDRAITVAEWHALGRQRGADALFALLDADGDGKLSVKELGAPSGALYGRFDAYDVDRNGFVVRREFPNFVDPLLVQALDRDHDGRLALSELRPGFAGRRAAPVPVAAPKAARAKDKPAAASWCWITGFGSDTWTIEAPVAWDRCRTR